MNWETCFGSKMCPLETRMFDLVIHKQFLASEMLLQQFSRAVRTWKHFRVCCTRTFRTIDTFLRGIPGTGQLIMCHGWSGDLRQICLDHEGSIEISRKHLFISVRKTENLSLKKGNCPLYCSIGHLNSCLTKSESLNKPTQEFKCLGVGRGGGGAVDVIDGYISVTGFSSLARSRARNVKLTQPSKDSF